jgi:hypothetical protein
MLPITFAAGLWRDISLEAHRAGTVHSSRGICPLHNIFQHDALATSANPEEIVGSEELRFPDVTHFMFQDHTFTPQVP